MDAVAGLRLKTKGGAEVKGSTPTVDDRTKGLLVVRWPTDSPKGVLKMKFSETELDISATGELKDNWFFELSSDPKAKLPFAKVDRQRLSCRYKQADYFVTTRKGVITRDADSALRITPESDGIVLEFSKR